MLTVKGVPLLASVEEILDELRVQCSLNGLTLFNKIKRSGTNVMCSCPFHKAGQERKPSFGVSITSESCHCFTCGWAGSLSMMISNVFGHEDDGDFGDKWLVKNFLTVSIENRRPLVLNLERGSKAQSKQQTFISEEELDSYRYTHSYMYERGLTDEIINMFDVGYDNHTNCLTFPVCDREGNVLFIARRSVVYKFFSYPEGAEKPVYGAHLFTSGKYKEAIITESILNALTCWVYGKPAMSLIGTGTEEQYKTLNLLPVRKYILGLDPDDAGRRATKRLQQNLESRKIVTRLEVPSGKDLNDLREDILTLPEFF